MADFAAYDPENLLLRRENGQFSEQGDKAGLALPTRGRGAAITDLNADGRLDLVVVNRRQPVSLFRNLGPVAQPANPADRRANDEVQSSASGGNWLQIELRQPSYNRDAIGARLSILTGNRIQTRRFQSGGGHASGNSGFMHVSLGVAERATVRVQWPDGQWSAPYRLFANNFAILTRGEDHVGYWYPQ